MTTSTAVSLAKLAHDLLRDLVGAKALEHRRAKLAAPRPLHELELADQPRLDEVRAFRGLPAVEWAGLVLQGLHELEELFEHRVREAGADLARIDEFTIVVVADQQRAGQAAAPPRLVGRVELLAHDALEPRLPARLEHGRAASFLIRRRLP